MFRFAVFFVVVSTGLAQVSSSTLSGAVRDESGALVPNAEVALRGRAASFERTTVTDAEGMFRMDEILPGSYTLTVSRPGFKTLEADDVELEVNQIARVEVTLKIGDQAETVSVTGALSPVQTEEASVGYRLGSRMIISLPLADRNAIGLLTLGPGAIPRHLGGFTHDVIGDVQPARGGVALNPPINGARSNMNFYVLDGAVNTDLNTYAMAVNPPIESIQEFRLQSSLASAGFPQAGGGVIDLVTKSGTNTIHGNAFEYFRNETLDARNFFDAPDLPRPVFRRHQFGGTLGGPVPRIKAFFFAGYEGLRGTSAKSSLNLVPEADLREGDFAGRATIFDPLNIDPVSGERQPFAGNRIPASRISPVAKAFLERFQPLPNRQGTLGNYLDATPNHNRTDSFSVRLDHDSAARRRLTGRYTFNEQDDVIAANFPERPTTLQLRAQEAALSHTYAQPSWLNVARVSFTRLRIFSLPTSAFTSNIAAELGITGLPDDPFTFGLPNFLITNLSTVTDSTILPQLQRDNLWHFSNTVSVARARHTLKAGAECVNFQFNYLQTLLARGRFVFTGAFTRSSPTDTETGDAFADFLLGFPQVTSRNLGLPQAYMRRNTFAGFLQDEWRLHSGLTLNLGLRYEYFSPFSEQRNNLLNLDYSGLPDAPELTRVRTAVDPDTNNFSPRIGIAWRLPGWGARLATVFRAGYGIYHQPEIAIEAYDLVRNNVRSETNSTDGSSPILTLENGFPPTATTGFPTYFGLDRSARTPYVQQWTAGFQREVPAGVVLELAYVGSKGTKLGRFRQLNTPLAVVTGENRDPRTGSLQSLRPFPELGEIIHRQHISNSSYHSLQARAEKRMAQHLAFLASFVWSKSIDDADTIIPGFFESAGAQDERNLRLERGLSFFDVRRRFSAGVVFEVPSAPFARIVFSNWRIAGTITLQDGTPANPFYFAFDPANTGTPNRPNIVPGQRIALPRNERSPERFFNTDAFSAPEPFTFGNAGRNIIPGPGANVFDVAVHRRFPISEEQALELRAELFNIFNHPNFGIPGPYPDFGPFFGRIFATGQPRRVQLALRYEF